MSTVDRQLKLSPLLYHVLLHLRACLNGLGQLSRTPWASVAIFVVIGVALALPMGLFVALDNLTNVTSSLKQTGEINLYLTPGLGQNEVDELKRVIVHNQSVAGVQYISPQAGMSAFLQAAGFSNALANLDNNPLPGVLVITPSPTLKQTYQIQQLYQQLSQLPHVVEGQLDLMWLKRLQAMLAVGHRLASLLMSLFFIAVIFVIGNTISLTTKAYHQEIRVIKLLGGTDSFVRLPFLYSGIIYGLVGAIIAFFIVDVCAWLLRGPIAQLTNLYQGNFQLSGLDNTHVIYLVSSGICLGFLGAWFAVGKQLKQDRIA